MSDPSVMQALANLVPRGSRVLDLGCGNGAFLSLLQSQRKLRCRMQLMSRTHLKEAFLLSM